MRQFGYAFVIFAAFYSPAEAEQLANVAEPASVEESAEPPVSLDNPPAPKPAIRPLPPTLKAAIDLSKQRMVVSENGKVAYSWPISSGRVGYRTPTGTFRPQWLTRMHYSKKYDNAPMPYSVFFHHGFAIHATYATSALGRPASHGCIRLAPLHAKTFYKLVETHGKGRTRIAVTGVAPAAVAKRQPKSQHVGLQPYQQVAPKPKARSAGPSRGYYVQPRQYVWPGDPAPRAYYKPRYESKTYGSYGNYSY